MTWSDSQGSTCDDYKAGNFCTDGNYGIEWYKYWNVDMTWSSKAVGWMCPQCDCIRTYQL